MKITIEKDWEWYLAKVEGRDDIYAFWYTEEEAKTELLGVADMIMDFHLEQVEKDRKVKNTIISNFFTKHSI